jgi:hypothetical protein
VPNEIEFPATPPTEPHPRKSRYLGDGLYALHHNYRIELRANDPNAPTDRVFLEPEVLKQLIRFARDTGALEEA